MDAVAEQLREEARRLEAHGAAWGGSGERECQEEAGILRACADELSDEQRRRTHGGHRFSAKPSANLQQRKTVQP